MPESTVNYELDTEEAVTWTAKSTLALMMDPLSRKNEDIFLSQSEIYFENPWALWEIKDKDL